MTETMTVMNAPNPNTHSANRRSAAPIGALGTILILCAEEEVRDVMAYWLGGSAAHTVVAEDGYHAAKVLENGCNWLVTDRVLPPWPGLDSLPSLRSRHSQLRIAFVESGNIHDGILARVTGAHVLLQRPLTRHGVTEALARFDS
jgi:DNA-binding response OmpR family regulator